MIMASRYSILKGGLPKKDPKEEEIEGQVHDLLTKYFKTMGRSNPEKFRKTLERLHKDRHIPSAIFNEFIDKISQQIQKSLTIPLSPPTEEDDDDDLDFVIGSCSSSGARNGGC